MPSNNSNTSGRFAYFDGSIFEHVVNDGQPYRINPAFRVVGFADAANPRIPGRDQNYVFDFAQLRDVVTWLMAPQGTGLWLSGPTGCGKTSVITEIAARLNWPVISQTISGRFEFSELKGQFVLSQARGETQPRMRYQHNALALAMRHGYILVLNEADLADPAEMSGLNDVLEGRPLVISENQGEVIRPDPMFRIVVTANSSGQGDDTGAYQGVQQQNIAALDRYRMLRVDYPSEQVEKEIVLRTAPGMPDELAERCVTFAKQLRAAHKSGTLSVPFSTRTLRHWVQTSAVYRTSAQNPLRKSLALHFLNRLSEEEGQGVELVAKTVFGPSWDEPQATNEDTKSPRSRSKAKSKS